MFLAALDQTIVATALSTISRDLDGTTGSLSWVSGAYLLCITAMAPISGKVSDYVGRKAVLYTAIVIFIIVSLSRPLRRRVQTQENTDAVHRLRRDPHCAAPLRTCSGSVSAGASRASVAA